MDKYAGVTKENLLFVIKLVHCNRISNKVLYTTDAFSLIHTYALSKIFVASDSNFTLVGTGMVQICKEIR